MADWASLPPNLPAHSPMGPLTLAKGSPLEEGARSPGGPEAALPTPRSRQWWFYRLTGQSWQGLGDGGAGRKQGIGPPYWGQQSATP